MSSAEPPLGKYLASSDKKTRDKAIRGLITFLSDPSRDALPTPEMAKLWKGIFYCFWMSDKPLVQQGLAAEISQIVLSISTLRASLDFLRGFWEATVREWSGIDRLRMDKYYMLVRKFVHASFALLIREEWDEDTCSEYNSILTERGGPLCPDDIRVPSSLAYHLADIYLEELDKALGDSETPLPAPLSTLLSPFFVLAARTQSNITFQRIQSALLDPLFSSLSSEREDEPPTPKKLRLSVCYDNLVSNSCSTNTKTEGAVEKAPLKTLILRRLFDIASEQDTRDSNRRKLYAIWRSHMEEEEGAEEKSVDAS